MKYSVFKSTSSMKYSFVFNFFIVFKSTSSMKYSFGFNFFFVYIFHEIHFCVEIFSCSGEQVWGTHGNVMYIFCEINNSVMCVVYVCDARMCVGDTHDHT